MTIYRVTDEMTVAQFRAVLAEVPDDARVIGGVIQQGSNQKNAEPGPLWVDGIVGDVGPYVTSEAKTPERLAWEARVIQESDNLVDADNGDDHILARERLWGVVFQRPVDTEEEPEPGPWIERLTREIKRRLIRDGFLSAEPEPEEPDDDPWATGEVYLDADGGSDWGIRRSEIGARYDKDARTITVTFNGSTAFIIHIDRLEPAKPAQPQVDIRYAADGFVEVWIDDVLVHRGRL